MPLRLVRSPMSWRTFWRFTLAIALGGAVAELAVKLLSFFVILERRIP